MTNDGSEEDIFETKIGLTEDILINCVNYFHIDGYIKINELNISQESFDLMQRICEE